MGARWAWHARCERGHVVSNFSGGPDPTCDECESEWDIVIDCSEYNPGYKGCAESCLPMLDLAKTRRAEIDELRTAIVSLAKEILHNDRWEYDGYCCTYCNARPAWTRPPYVGEDYTHTPECAVTQARAILARWNEGSPSGGLDS